MCSPVVPQLKFPESGMPHPRIYSHLDSSMPGILKNENFTISNIVVMALTGLVSFGVGALAGLAGRVSPIILGTCCAVSSLSSMIFERSIELASYKFRWNYSTTCLIQAGGQALITAIAVTVSAVAFGIGSPLVLGVGVGIMALPALMNVVRAIYVKAKNIDTLNVNVKELGKGYPFINR